MENIKTLDKNNKDEFGFRYGEYWCHSPAQHDWLLLEKGIFEDYQKDVTWTLEDRNKYIEEHGLSCKNPDGLGDLKRIRWVYTGTQQLSDALNEWQLNNPKRKLGKQFRKNF